MSEIDKVVRALVGSLGVAPDPAPQKWPSTALCVFDSILSLDRRNPGSVEETIRRLQKPDPEYGALGPVRNYVASFPSPAQFFLVDLRDKEAKRAPLLLPLLDGLIDTFRDFPENSEREQARAWAAAARASDWTFGPFRGLGLNGFQHLRQLLGANTVVPSKDRLAYVAKAVGRPVSASEAIFLLERAAARLRYDLAGTMDNA